MRCEKCECEHDGNYGSGRFCSQKCSRSFSTLVKRKEINDKVSKSLSGRIRSSEHREKALETLKKSGKGIGCDKIIKSCLHCGNEMQLLQSQRKRKFCSQICWVKYTEENKESFLLYRQRCKFKFNVYEFPSKFDLTIIDELGWYSPSNKKNNLDGVSRDHMLSVSEGYSLGIDPEIISHPANCEIIPHRKNQKKRHKSSMSLEELIEKIKNW